MTNEEFFAELDRLGAAEVRGRIATNVYLGGHRGLAEAWLARDSEIKSAEQLLLARRASTDAHNANKIATIALIIAIISLVVTVIGIFNKP
jgi:hypothetical protein